MADCLKYLGARYVPKWANPLKHDQTKEYEPLTVVYSCGRTFISKTLVPIGIPLPDYTKGEEQNDYWVLYADYNIQMEIIREQIVKFSTRYDNAICALQKDLNDNVTTINNRIDQEVTNLNETINNVNETINNRIDQEVTNLTNKINQEVQNLTNQINNVEQTLNNRITNEVTTLNNTITNLNTRYQSSINSLLSKIFSGGTLNSDGTITWPNDDKIAIGNMNWYAGNNNENHIRTRQDGTNDMRAQ